MSGTLAPVDVRQPGYDVFPSSVEISASFSRGTPVSNISFTLDGMTVVERGAAKIARGRFTIPTWFRSLNHTGVVPALGGAVRLSLRPGASAPEGEVTGIWNAEQNAPQFPAQSIFRNVAVRIETAAGSFDLEPANVSAEINGIPPLGDEYGHPQQLRILQGRNAVGTAVAKHKVHKNGKRHADREPCPPPCCSVQASGHCSRFLVRDQDGLREQLLFVASQPGVPASPVGKDRVLAYETITNYGPRAVRVYWDGLPTTYESPNQSALLLPGNSITVAVDRAVKVVYSPDPGLLAGDYAEGYDVISWCCPDPWK